MPFELKLPKRLKAAGWKVKVREKERVEPPHVTVLCHTREWRIGLRDSTFLVPPGGRWKDLDEKLVEVLRANGTCSEKRGTPSIPKTRSQARNRRV